MKKYFLASLMGMLISSFVFGPVFGASEVRKLFVGDLDLQQTDGGGAETTVSPGGKSGTRIHGGALPWDNSYSRTIRPKNMLMGIDNGITFRTRSTPFTMHSSNNTFNGVRDDLLYWAYNLTNGGITARDNTSEPQLKFAIESHYYDGATHWMEYNMDYLSSDGLVAIRPFAWGMDRATNTGFWNFRTDETSGATLHLSDNNATIGLAANYGTRLEVYGKTADDSASALGIFSSAGGTSLFKVRNDGNIGIGVDAPAYNLDIRGAGTANLLATYPGFYFNVSNQTADNKKWLFLGNGLTFELRAVDSSEAAFETVFKATRSGGTITKVHIGGLQATSNVGIGPQATSPGARLEVDGGVRLKTATAIPTCDVNQRGTFWVEQGGAGVKDNVVVCAKDNTDSYAWRTIY